MGQVSDNAALACSFVVQVFVKDMATKMQQQAVAGVGLTPIELKKSVLASDDLSFLHEKVAVIDENDAKYLQFARRGKKRTVKSAEKKSTTKKARRQTTRKTSTAIAASAKTKKTEQAACNEVIRGDDCGPVRMQPLDIEEDENYDESDSDV